MSEKVKLNKEQEQEQEQESAIKTESTLEQARETDQKARERIAQEQEQASEIKTPKAPERKLNLITEQYSKLESHQDCTIEVTMIGEVDYKNRSGLLLTTSEVTKRLASAKERDSRAPVSVTEERETVRNFARGFDRLTQPVKVDFYNPESELIDSASLFLARGFDLESPEMSNHWIAQFASEQESESEPRLRTVRDRYCNYKTRKKSASELKADQAQAKKDGKNVDNVPDWLYVKDSNGNVIPEKVGDFDLDFYYALNSLAKIVFASLTTKASTTLTKAEIVTQLTALASEFQSAMAMPRETPEQEQEREESLREINEKMSTLQALLIS